MSIELMTEKEKARYQEHIKICNIYKAMRAKYGEDVKDSRIFCKMAEELKWSSQGIRNIIFKFGLAKKQRL